MNPFKAAAAKVLAEELDAIGVALQSQEATVADLQQQIRTLGWQRVSGGGEKATFNRSEIGIVVEQCRAAAIKNPLIIRGLAVRQDYIWGQGVSIESDDEAADKAIKAALRDRRNQRQLTGQQGFRFGQLEMDATGNLFVACMAADSAGRRINPPQLRTIPLEQMRGVVVNPEDAEEVWFWRREREVSPLDAGALDGLGATVTVVEYHPTLDHWREQRAGRSRLDTIGDHAVRWDAPIAHRRRGGYQHWNWGLPLVYPAIDWATAHTRYLSNWDSFVAALASVAVRMTGKGVTQDQLNAAKTAMQSGFAAGAGRETNPPNVAGSVLALNDKWQYDTMRANGMAPEIGDAKGFRLQIGAALGVPDHILSGDADQGNFATSRTLDRPTELALLGEQREWAEFLTDVVSWIVEVSAVGGVRSAVQPELIRVVFPPILEHDPAESVGALSKAISAPIGADLRGAEYEIRKALLAAAGAGNVQEILDNADFDPEASAQDDPSGDPPNPERDANEAVFARLVRRVVEEARRQQ